MLLVASAAAYGADTMISPTQQINWPLATGSGAPTATCSAAYYGMPYTDRTTSTQYVCTSGGWAPIGPVFSAIKSGTNTQASMLVGTGASISPADSGTITATHSVISNYASNATPYELLLTAATGSAQSIGAASSGLTYTPSTGLLATGALTLTGLASTSGSYCLQIDTAGVISNTGQACGNATGGSVTYVTFTGDGTVLSSTPSTAVTTTGTLNASLAYAPAYSVLSNSTSGTAYPSYTATPTVSGLTVSGSGSIFSVSDAGTSSAATATIYAPNKSFMTANIGLDSARALALGYSGTSGGAATINRTDAVIPICLFATTIQLGGSCTDGTSGRSVYVPGTVGVGTTASSVYTVDIYGSPALTSSRILRVSNGVSTTSGVATFVSPNLPTGSYNVVNVGVDETTSYNAASLSFNYSGSTSTANYAGIGLSGHDNLLNVFGTGHVSIGATVDSGYVLDVAGVARFNTSVLTPRVIPYSGTTVYIGEASTAILSAPNVSVGDATSLVYRCTTAGTLPIGALTTVTGNCGASTSTKLTVN